jgi:hypothetical protein
MKSEVKKKMNVTFARGCCTKVTPRRIRRKKSTEKPSIALQRPTSGTRKTLPKRRSSHDENKIARIRQAREIARVRRSRDLACFRNYNKNREIFAGA